MTYTVHDWQYLRDTIPGALSIAECEVLADHASRATRALEVGHYYGLSTAVLLQSLPAGCELVTVDHHRGDDWSVPAPVEKFLANIRPYERDEFQFYLAPFKVALPTIEGTFDLVFYDADHHADAVYEFWKLVEPLLAEHATLVYDDADWDQQAILGRLARQAGFESVRDREFVRGEKDKASPETYALEVLGR